MIRIRIIILLLGALIFGCSERGKDTRNIADSNEWELVILDSIQVDYLGSISGGEFRNGTGVFYNFQQNQLIEFDSTGSISHETSYPKDGPGKVEYPTQLRYTSDGRLFAASFMGWLYELNTDLTLK